MPLAKIALASLFALLTVAPQNGESDSASAQDLRKLSWLAGTWELQEGDTTTQEHWLPLAGSNMIGISHTYDARATRSFEFLRITFQDGKLAYVAQPGGGEPVPFFAVRIDEREAVFENPEHDHPQRIRYERKDAGVTATVSLLDGAKAQTFAYRRKEK